MGKDQIPDGFKSFLLHKVHTVPPGTILISLD